VEEINKRETIMSINHLLPKSLASLGRTFTRSLSVGAALCAMASPTLAQAPESDDPIRVALHEWTGGVFSAHLVVRILGEMGYNAEAIPIDASAIYPALATGDMTLDVETWTGVHPEIFPLIEDGSVHNIGVTGLVGMDRWWYPSYVKDECPGLPSYEALNECAALFSTVDTGDKGRLLLYSADWGGNDDERVASLGLNYEIVRVGSEAALLAEVQSAVQREAPILAWLYEPHWAPVKYDGEYVELPAFTEECQASGKFNCEKPTGDIIKISWPGMEDKWPGAYKALQGFSLTNEEYGTIIEDADLNGVSIDDLVDRWMDENKDRWSAWIGK
jgi:glycine betaine/proline transport system substrate-binding protein